MEKFTLYEKIKAILNEWDPIGVYFVPLIIFVLCLGDL
jgi:hypothetical protein